MGWARWWQGVDYLISLLNAKQNESEMHLNVIIIILKIDEWK